jgi:hypothetical protein
VELDDGQTTTITFEVKAIEHDNAPIVPQAQNWSGTVYESIGQNNTKNYGFTLYIPLYLTNEEFLRVKDVNATISGGILSDRPTIVFANGKVGDLREFSEGIAYVQINATTPDFSKVMIESVTYRLGINRYTKTLRVPLTTVPLKNGIPPVPSDEDDVREGGGGGGCNAGIFGLLVFVLLVCVTIKRKMHPGKPGNMGNPTNSGDGCSTFPPIFVAAIPAELAVIRRKHKQNS